MNRSELEAAIEQAHAEGWHYVANKAPALGERVQVMHILNRSYDNEGECDESGAWHCCNGFILPNGLFTFNPTHWRSRDSDASLAEDPKGLSGEAVAARAEGIAK